VKIETTVSVASAPKRIIAIGDIHGCAHALDAVLDAICPAYDDLIISLGDFIDTGRETREVIEQLIQLRSECQFVSIMGNHEQMLLAALTSDRLKDSWLMCGGVATINSYRFCGDESETPLSDQPEHLLRWSLLDDGIPEPHQSGKTVIVGHTEQRDGEILDAGHIMCIDTYCHSYGWLTAIDVISGEVWQASRWGSMREGDTMEGLLRAKRILRP
jgi:serine/threonine protein phosphatase 1